jgi:nucleoside-diphosphate-sugar epimerase
MSKPLLVLGYGAVGRAVVERLGARGDRVLVAQRREPAGLPPDVRFLPVDLLVRESVLAAASGVGGIICCAGFPYRSALWERAWPRAMDNMLTAAAGTRFVFADNLYMYGPQTVPLIEELPLTDYGRKPKLRAHITRLWQAAHGRGLTEAVAVRASDFYGPRVTTSVLSSLGIARLVAGKAAVVPYCPHHAHDFTYVPDFARALVTLLDASSDCYGQAWHVPNAPTRTLRQLLALAARQLDRPLRVIVLQEWFKSILGSVVPDLREMIEMRFQTDRSYRVDSGKFARRFWDDPVPFSEGIGATIASYR